MTIGLPVSRLIQTSVSLSPQAAQYANLSTPLIMGESAIIDTNSRLRLYTGLTAVAADFGTTAPEYLAAQAFFSQSPQPTSVLIGRWAHAASSGVLIGESLTTAQQALTVWQAFTAGQFKIQVDGAASPVSVTCGSMAGVTNLNGVATIINAALTTATVGATCVWNATYNRFQFTSATTGTTSKVKPLTAGVSNDISAALGCTAATGATEVDGIAAESAVTAVTIMDGLATSWYGLSTDASPDLVDADIEAISAYVQGSSNPHIYGFTTSEAAAINPSATSDVGYVLSTGTEPTRSFGCYSSQTPYESCSVLGRLATVNWQGVSTAINLMYQQMPGVTPENLQSSQAASLDAKRYNYVPVYNNGASFLENGWMLGPAYIDEIVGMDWLANQVQTNVFNVLAGAITKVPQTDAGNHQLATAAATACQQGVTNGLLAPGAWNSGALSTQGISAVASAGYFVYQPPVATQSVPGRAARQSVVFQIAAKLAGAIDSADLIISVNR